jgi:hypothetical protein
LGDNQRKGREEKGRWLYWSHFLAHMGIWEKWDVCALFGFKFSCHRTRCGLVQYSKGLVRFGIGIGINFDSIHLHPSIVVLSSPTSVTRVTQKRGTSTSGSYTVMDLLSFPESKEQLS